MKTSVILSNSYNFQINTPIESQSPFNESYSKYLEKDEDFVELNDFLSNKSYISGYTISYDDIIVAMHLENNTNPTRLEEILKQHKFRYLIMLAIYNSLT